MATEAASKQEPSVGVTLLEPKSVLVGWRARKDDGDISELAESIQRIGQLHPIVVRHDKKGAPVIIAGLRRLRACRKLGIKVKATFIAPEGELETLAVQLEENIKRKDFDRLEVGEGLKRYKALFEKKHGLGSGWNLKAAARADGGKAKAGGVVTGDAFIAEVARSLNLGKSAVYDLLGIADLPDEDKKEIAKAKTSRERNVAASKALSKVRKERKLKKLEAEAEKKAKARAKEKAATKGDKKAPKKEAEPTGPEVLVAEGDYRKLIKAPLFVKQYKGKIDLVFTDPPYDLERNPILHTARAAINDSALAKWDRLDIAWVMDIAPLLSQTGSVIAFAPLELVGLYKVAMQRAKLTYRGCIVWHKTNPAPAHRSVYAPSCEAIVWGTRGDKYVFKPWENAGTSDAHNHVDLPVCGGNERLAHPAQKPLALVQRLIDRHTDKAAQVFDPFMGTGTTLVACRKLGLGCIGIESDPKFSKMAKTRVAASA
jgi:DNA modification methylase